MEKIKRIALVAHDSRKKDLIEWLEFNWRMLSLSKLTCTGTTGRLVKEALQKKGANFDITILKSGPLGGDVELSAMIAEREIDVLVFFWDPMEPQPHDVDVKALLRIATLYNIPSACNRSTADFIISSPLFKTEYKPILKDYGEYINRKLENEK